MPVRNKKKLQANRQKLETLQHQKQFVSNIKDLIIKATGPEVLRFIPEYEIEYLYKVRFHPVRVKAAPGEKIPADILGFANRVVTLQFKHTFISVEVGSIMQLSLYEYYSTAYTLMTYIDRLKDDDFSHAVEVKKALAPFAAVMNSPVNNLAADRYHKITITAAMFCCDYSQHLYTLKFNASIMARGFQKWAYLVKCTKPSFLKLKSILENMNVLPGIWVGIWQTLNLSLNISQ